MRRGWSVVPLHHLVAPGVCSCHLGAACPPTTQGKHPVSRAWGEHGLASGADVQAVWDDRPAANVGIITGPPSGVFVLDVDPKSGGFERLRELTEDMGRDLPPTYTVRTGSGGVHYYFALPPADAGVRITNSRGRLPVGLDIRGEGGQVVAPPSVSGVGPYSIAAPLPVAQAPNWLIEAIRIRADTPAEVTRADPAAAARLAALDPGERRRLAQYAATAVEREIARLGAAGAAGASGSRNETAFAVACNLIEIANSWWADTPATAARERYDIVTGPWSRAADPFPRDEARACWIKAAAKVADKARPYPDAPDPTHVLGAPVPPHYAAQDAAPDETPLRTVETVDETAPVTSGGAVAPLRLDALTAPAPPATAPAAADDDAWERAVDGLLGELLDSAALDLIADPEPLVQGYLDRDTVTWIIGPPGEGKSFVALSLAAAVAGGDEWFGSPVRAAGPVLYLVAEGARGFKRRVRAWEKHHGKTMAGVRILPRPVQAMGHEWAVLVEVCRRLKPVLIVIDTQARVTVGIKENDAGEMGEFVDRSEQLRAACGATVLIIHHTTKGGSEGRGSGALKGAMNSEISVKMTERGADSIITVSTTKQKDMARAADMELLATVVELGTDEYGDPVTSLVLTDPVAASAERSLAGLIPGAAGPTREDNGSVVKLLDLMKTTFSGGIGGTKSEVKSLAVPGKMSQASFHRAWGTLLDRGAVARVSGTQSYRFVPIEDGRAGLTDAHGEWIAGDA